MVTFQQGSLHEAGAHTDGDEVLDPLHVPDDGLKARGWDAQTIKNDEGVQDEVVADDDEDWEDYEDEVLTTMGVKDTSVDADFNLAHRPKPMSPSLSPKQGEPPARPDIRQYSYKPLIEKDEIRLLVLEPAERKDDPLKGFLHHASLSKTSIGTMAPLYEALSYVWGNSDKVDRIEAPSGFLAITHSLRAALRQIRNVKLPIVVWADAICINQHDNSEKASQVQMMGRIFSSAHRVLAILGEDTEAEDAAFCIDRLVHLAKLDGSETFHLHPDAHQAFYKLVSLPWFARIWIIQEFALAGNVLFVWGSNFFPWEFLRDAAHDNKLRECLLLHLKILEKPRDVAKIPKTVVNLIDRVTTLLDIRERFQQNGHIPLHELYIRVKGTAFQSTIPQDRLFGLLGMASDNSHELLRPDYDVPLETVLLRYGKYLLDHVGFDLLYYAGLGSVPGCGPSWMPDYSRTMAASGLVGVDISRSWDANPASSFNAGLRARNQGDHGKDNRQWYIQNSRTRYIENDHRPYTTQDDAITLQAILLDDINQVGPTLDGADRTVNYKGGMYMPSATQPQGMNPDLVEGGGGGYEEFSLEPILGDFRRSWCSGSLSPPTVPASDPLTPNFRSPSKDVSQEDETDKILIDYSELVRRLLLIMKEVVDPIRHLHYPTDEDLLTVQLRVLLHDESASDVWPPRVSETSSPESEQLASDMETSASKQPKIHPPGPEIRTLKKAISLWTSPQLEMDPAPSMRREYDDLDRRVYHALNNTSMVFHTFGRHCNTKKGFLGHVPSLTQKGDIVCVAEGSRLPFIIRPSTERPEMFRLIGACYIHGIMNGEAFEGDQKLETVKIH